MREERIELSQREQDRLKVLHQVEQGYLTQVEAGRRVQVSVRHLRRLLRRVRAEGDRGVVHRLRGRPSNRKIPAALQGRILAQVRRRYADFGPTLASEHLARDGWQVSRETLRQWMTAAGLWRSRRQRRPAVHVWRERRAAFGELVMMDSSPYRWLERRGPPVQLIALIDDATNRVWGRFAAQDSTEENLRTLAGWLRRWGRPRALYTDKNSLFRTTRSARLDEQLGGQPARTQIGRALQELGIEWIPAHSPQAKGRIERLFGTLQDRLVKEMRLAGVHTVEQANRFLAAVFLPFWEQRFTVAPRQPHDAHRPLGGTQRLESILSVREPRRVAGDYTVRWQGQRWAIPRAQVRAGLRGARVEVERRLDGSRWVRFRGSYLSLRPCPSPPPAPATPFRPTAYGACGPKERQTKVHSPSRSPLEEDISIWQKTGHFYFALTGTNEFLARASLNGSTARTIPASPAGRKATAKALSPPAPHPAPPAQTPPPVGRHAPARCLFSLRGRPVGTLCARAEGELLRAPGAHPAAARAAPPAQPGCPGAPPTVPGLRCRQLPQRNKKDRWNTQE